MNTTIRFGTAAAQAQVWEYETPFNYTNMEVVHHHLPEGHMEVVVLRATVEYYGNGGVTPVTTIAALAAAIGLPVGELGSELAEANL